MYQLFHKLFLSGVEKVRKTIGASGDRLIESKVKNEGEFP
jgi:hypothetical protein